MKILILKPSSLGDVVQALPVLRLIKRHLPRSEVYWWVDSRLAPLLEGDPDLAGLVRFERDHWARNWIALLRSVMWARTQTFDWVIDLQCLARSGAFAWLANGNFTVGLDEPREGARGFYDRIARRASFHTHAVDWYLSVLALLGVPASGAIEWLPHRPQIAERLVSKWRLAQGEWILLQPGARWLNKRWPAESFAELVKLLITQRPQARFAILGGQEDKKLGESITNAIPGKRCVDLTGQLSLPEMVECIRMSALMVTNDTGPMHVAAAIGKPVVAIFGPTEPRRTGPYGQVAHALQACLPCVPCLSPRCHNPKKVECLRAITPQTVCDSVLMRLPAGQQQ